MIFKSFIIYPTFPDSVTMHWELTNNELDGNYKFYIKAYRGSDIAFDSGVLYNKYSYKLNYIPFLSYGSLNDLKFTITCITPRKINGADTFTYSATIYHGLEEADEFNIASEIIRKENLLFERKIGLRAYIFKRKKYGPICEYCTDKLTGSIINSNCSYCYGTKYGYYDPIKVWADIVESPVEKAVSDLGTTEDKKAQIRMTNEILVSKHDIVLDYINNIKWDISTEPTYVKYRSYPISQQFIATAVDPKASVNRLTVDTI